MVILVCIREDAELAFPTGDWTLLIPGQIAILTKGLHV